MKQKYIVGDWVKFLSEKSKVIEVYEDSSYFMDSPNITGCPKEEELSPILLTPEILEKNGWEHKDDIYFKEFPHRKLVIMDENAYIINECCSMFLCPAKFVIQLQHLLFGLGINHEMEV